MTEKPNILLFLTDGMQAETVIPGHPCQTPNMDRLAESGLRFTRAYTPSPTCSPARASLMTGLLPHNHGVLHVEHTVDDDQDLLRETDHWAQLLSREGYNTGYFGKWHIERSLDLRQFGWHENGAQQTPHFEKDAGKLIDDLEAPLDARFTGYRSERAGYAALRHYGVTDIPIEDRTVSHPARVAGEFLSRVMNESDPWCCCVSYPSPNEAMICSRESFKLYDPDSIDLPANLKDPFTRSPNLYRRAQEVWMDISDDDWRMARACYYARISELDQQLGLLIAQIEAAGQLENTIIIVTSDHGKYVGAHGFDAHNFGAFEEIYRIPLIMAGPGIAAGSVTSARVGLHDLGRTIPELSGSQFPDAADSISFKSLVGNPVHGANGFDVGFGEYHGTRFPLMQRVVWEGDWKFIWNGFDYDELYDLKEDPHEMNNLARCKDLEGRIHAMTDLMWQFIKKTGDRTLATAHYYSMRFAAQGPDLTDV